MRRTYGRPADKLYRVGRSQQRLLMLDLFPDDASAVSIRPQWVDSRNSVGARRVSLQPRRASFDPTVNAKNATVRVRSRLMNILDASCDLERFTPSARVTRAAIPNGRGLRSGTVRTSTSAPCNPQV